MILTSSSDEKLARAQALGADHLINYRTEPDWHERARAITGGRGVDHVVEIGGAATLERSIAALRPSGTISLIGVLGGNAPTLPLGRVVTRNLRLQGVTVGSRDTFEAMVRAIEVAGSRPVLDERRFAFEEVGEALAALPEGRHFGKVVGSELSASAPDRALRRRHLGRCRARRTSDRPDPRARRRRSARPRTATAAPAPSRRRTAPARCCAPGSPRCWSPGC